ncbi:MAG: alpha/beta fold hydrolase, partial [Gammaproteobacteria bacterium]
MVRIIGVAIMCAGCTLPPPPSPDWAIPSLTSYSASGAHRVVVDELLVEHPALQKQLPVRISFPREDGRFPIIVFSHGAYSSKDDYNVVLDHWASHGYVVIAATHSDSTALGVERGDPEAASGWVDRMADLTFLLNEIDSLSQRVKGLAGKPDPTRVAATGHSLGALTALALAGVPATDRRDNQRKTFYDERVKVALMISPPGAIPGLVDNGGFASVKVPSLYTTATRDIVMLPDTTWEWHKDSYRMAPAGGRMLIVLKGADHYLGGVVGRDDLEHDSRAGEFVDIINALTTAYLDAYLKQSSRAQAMLQASDRL